MCFMKSITNSIINIILLSSFLKHTYTISEINHYKANLLILIIILESTGYAEKPISHKEAATINSISGTQWTKCKAKGCACRSALKIYNSKYHASLARENKNRK